jgi:predicted AlkP superfamily pyrophosphatase or phosphodiesterase
MTFPSHYSMATGLYPERHGIVSNRMYSPTHDAWFAIGNRDPAWWGGEPIWLTAERQGMIAATFFWPGSDVPIDGRHATYWYRFDASIPNEDRVDQVLRWLALPADEQPRLITLYFEDVDQTAHAHRIDSPELQRAVSAVDAAIGRLTDGIARMEARDEVNLIIVSDHGMAERSPERVIFMDDFVDLDAVTVVDWNPVWMASAVDDNHDRLYRRLRDAHPNLTVYRREDMPERFHFKNNDRVPPVIAIADEGWSITTRTFFTRNPQSFVGHTHGYDNRAESMGAIFIASGPAFAEATVVPPFESVNVYALVCHVLDIEPAPNDGSLDAIREALR